MTELEELRDALRAARDAYYAELKKTKEQTHAD
jgi:hypothetical protein